MPLVKFVSLDLREVTTFLKTHENHSFALFWITLAYLRQNNQVSFWIILAVDKKINLSIVINKKVRNYLNEWLIVEKFTFG